MTINSVNDSDRSKILTTEIKDFCLQQGADLVGIADPKALHGSPHGHPSPFTILPDAKSIVVIAKRIPHGAVEIPHPPMDGPTEDLEVVHGGAYVSAYMTLNWKLFNMGFDIADHLERRGYLSVPISPTVPRDEIRWVGTISMRKCGEEAGLGEIGVNQNLITPQFGPRVRLAAIITKAPLIPDGPVLKGKVCTKCYKCIEKCPVHAIGETPPVPPDNFNRKRCIWGAAFGFYKASGGQQPPEEWANAETLQDMTALIPKYKEMYPRINYYTNLSAKVMGYPNCTECYKYCSVGMDSRKVMADRD